MGSRTRVSPDRGDNNYRGLSESRSLLLKNCAFETPRLLVKEWHLLSSGDWQQQELGQVVAALLTEPVTRSLPTSWHGSYTPDRAREWIKQRDREGATLLVIDKLTQRPVGLLILLQMRAEEEDGDREVRLGYLLAEDAWGQGIASELVRGFVGWCRNQTSISSIAGGVALDNPASRRVLQKNSFQLVQSQDEIAQDEQLYRLRLHSASCLPEDKY